jgi:ATP-dependent DNA ligase
MSLVRTLYVLNNFNDISWWRATVLSSTVVITWGRMTPGTPYSSPQETAAARQEIPCDSPSAAEAEFYSRVRYQQDRKGYTENIPTAPPSLPMLAQEYKGIPDFPGYAFQPKLDGIRCILSRDGLLSRKNRFISSCPHLELYLPRIPDGIKLDGELYIPNTPFNVIESYVMRNTPDPKVSLEIEFHVFDIIDNEAPFEARIEEAARIVEALEEAYIYYRTTPDHPHQKNRFFSKKCPFSLVATTIVSDPAEVTDTLIQHQFKHYRSLGYEGMMIRNLHAPYEVNKRSRHLLKMKQFIDSEFEIVDVVAGSERQGIFVCATSSGATFRCSFRGTKGKRQNILKYKDTYIGKWLKVEYEGLFENGIPRCPVGIHYFDKDLSDKPLPTE